VLEFAQIPPELEQVGSVLHVHAADPAAPVQLWCAPVQAAGAPYAQHPLPPSVHVANLPPTHVVCPCVQLLVQVSEHPALGAIPEQVCGLVQDEVEATK
jgi:hypothetical protein